jgi:hypothetical protein
MQCNAMQCNGWELATSITAVWVEACADGRARTMHPGPHAGMHVCWLVCVCTHVADASMGLEEAVCALFEGFLYLHGTTSSCGSTYAP